MRSRRGCRDLEKLIGVVRQGAKKASRGEARVLLAAGFTWA